MSGFGGLRSRSPTAKCFLTAILLPVFISPAMTWAEETESIGWQVEARALELDGWRARWALGADGRGWLGGSHLETKSRDLLWQLDDGRLQPLPLPMPAARAYVLDVDSTGGLWLAIYSPGKTSTYDRLTIARHPGETGESDGSELWQLETVTPGLWPQAMAMAGPDRGWIGGNHTRLLERTAEGWQTAEVELLPWVERRDLNILDLVLTPDGEGLLVGTKGLVARLEDGVWRQLEAPESLAGRRLLALDLTADGAAWIGGDGGRIARWHPAEGWRVERPTTFALTGIDMVSEEEGWAVGKAGTILERRDGRWQNVAAPVADDLLDIVMEDPSRGWIVGRRLVLRGAPVERAWPLVERTPAILAGRSGLDVAVADLDRDGIVELLLAGHDEVRIFRQETGGWTAGPVLPRPDSPFIQPSDSWAVGDANGDGATDVLMLGAHGQDRHLFVNEGSGAFADATVRAGLGPFPGFATTAAWIDIDLDGDLDLQVSRGQGAWPLFGRLYVNDGVGRFAPHPLESVVGVPDQTVLGGDLDGDGDTDLVSLDKPRLHRNDGGVLVVMALANRLPAASGSVSAGAIVDLDLDGDLDLVWAGDRIEILRNDGFGHGGGFVLAESFDAALPDARAVFCRAGDLDHDGFPELLVHWRGVGAASTRLLTRGPDGKTREVNPSSSPFAGLGPLADAVLADLDGDGDLDPVLTGPRGTLLLEGRLDDQRGLRLRLHGDRGSVLGTTVRVRTASADAGAPAAPLLASVHAASGSGVLGEVHTGLGDASRVDVEVRFPAPGHRRVELRDVPAGSLLDVHDTAMPSRLWIRGHRVVWRRLAEINPLHEILKLGALLASLAILGAAFLRRPPARTLTRSSTDSKAPFASRHSRRRLVMASAGILWVLHPAATLALAPVASPLAHVGQVVGLVALAVLLLTFERRRAADHIGPYRLGALLGEGGMGAVYRARHRVRGQDVALKLLHAHLLRDEISCRRFLRESRLMAAVDHPSLVRVEEAGEIDGRGFIAMELLEGCSMSRHLADHGPLSAPAWRAAGQSLAGALAALHERGICHRDLKSENVFVLAQPTDAWSRRVRLMDLGLAWSASQATLTREHALIGTLATMAPERLRGHRADVRSDLWSLGVVLYEMATGRLPFVAKDVAGLTQAILNQDAIAPRQWNSALPPSHEGLILALLAAEPVARPENAWAVVRALASAPEAALPRALDARVEPAILPTEPSSASAQWQRLYTSAREHFAAGRLNQADVTLVACLQALRTRAARLDEGRRAAYLARPDVRAVLEFSQRLEHRCGESVGHERQVAIR